MDRLMLLASAVAARTGVTMTTFQYVLGMW